MSDPSGTDSPAGSSTTEDESHELAPSAAPTPGASKPAESRAPRARWLDRGTQLWIVGILVLLATELLIYGHNGHVKVCVGLEGITDYSLLQKPRSEATVRQFPYCSERLNLGMFSHGDEAAEASLADACSRASTLLHRDRLECIRRENHWTRHVIREQVPPWDARLYRQLLWLN